MNDYGLRHKYGDGDDQKVHLVTVPASEHKIGMVVPIGGSNCAKCKFMVGVGECSNSAWVTAPKAKGGGGGSTTIPAAIDRYCCDGFQAG